MLATKGMRVDIQGIVSHRHALITTAFTLAMGASFALSALLWPLVALAGMIAVIGSAMADMDAGRGWLRSFVTRDLSDNIVAWPADRETFTVGTPTLLITCPSEVDLIHQPIQSNTELAPLGVLLATAVVVAAQPWIGSYPTIIAAGILALGSIAAWTGDRLHQRNTGGNPARDVLLSAFDKSERPQHLRVVWALVGGGADHHDGLHTFLLNHEADLPRASTRVLALHPSTGACSWVRTEGRIRTSHADPILAALSAKSKMPDRSDTTAAKKAHQLGWRATGVCVPKDQLHLSTDVVCTIITGADQLVRAGQW